MFDWFRASISTADEFLFLQVADNNEFLFRGGTGKHDFFIVQPALNFFIIHFKQISASDNDSVDSVVIVCNVFNFNPAGFSHVPAGVAGNDTHLLSNGFGSFGVVTSDHDDFDTSSLAVADGVRDSVTRRIHEGNDTKKNESISFLVGEVVIFGVINGVLVVLVVGILIEIGVSHTQNAFAALHHRLGGFFEVRDVLSGHGNLLSVDHDEVASVHNALGSAFHEELTVLVPLIVLQVNRS
mmetsp:Transcript_34768/g.68308  ORF Transcript_34768/g.68308 Transcript_34768/m.68308 type:complete len:240 (+) Transcript_34768:1654-2373(+)